MRYMFTGKNVTVTDAMKNRTEQKLGRLDKLFPEDAEASVTISVVKNDHTVEVTIPLYKRILRAEVTANDMYAAIDEIVDILERQMIKYKERLRRRSGKETRFKEEFSRYADEADALGGEHAKIEKTKRFALKPMDAEEAVMEMEMLGHTFYVFRNGETDEVNVVYKRKNGSYGLIEPEF